MFGKLQNIDKYYRMQIINTADQFFFAMQWGRNGTKGQSQVKGPFDTQAEAAELMEKKFKAKTGNTWANRENIGKADSSQRKGRGHYELSARLDGGEEKKSTSRNNFVVDDGEWKAIWDHGGTADITLQNGRFSVCGIYYELSPVFDFVWADGTEQTVQSVDDDGTLHWTTTNKHYPHIKWVPRRRGRGKP